MQNSIVKFENQEIELVNVDGVPMMTLAQIGRALEISEMTNASKLYTRHADEFTLEMTRIIKQGRTRVRVFNREGAWLIGMFARTPKAAAFRKWVLTALAAHVDGKTAGGEVSVREHTRALPSGKREIVLSEKAKQEIGGIVKKCCAVAVREELSNPGAAEREAFNKYMLKYAEKISQTPLVDMKLSSREAKIIETIRRAYQFDDARFYSYALDFFPRAKTADA